MARVLLVDGNWYLHRAWHAVTARKDYRFLERSLPAQVLSMVIKDSTKLNCTHLAVIFDAPNSFRYKIYPRYKANRREISLRDLLGGEPDVRSSIPDINVYTFLETLKRVLRAAGITTVQIENMEADDALAAGALCLAEDNTVYLATRDKDLMQVLENSNIKMFWPGNKKNPDRLVDAKEVKKIKGVLPSQIRDFLILLGDKVDNIPGVPGVAEKTAVKILEEHGSISEAIVAKSKWGEKLRKYRDKLNLARKLIQLKTDCWGPELKDLALRPVNKEKLIKLIGFVPDVLNELHANSNMANVKGLFR